MLLNVFPIGVLALITLGCVQALRAFGKVLAVTAVQDGYKAKVRDWRGRERECITDRLMLFWYWADTEGLADIHTKVEIFQLKKKMRLSSVGSESSSEMA